MTDEAKLSHLKKLCSFDPWRSALSLPFLITVAGDSWSAASDGRMLFAWRGKVEGVEARKDAPRIPAEWIEKTLLASRQIGAEALRAWAGAPVAPSVGECSNCEGEGVVEHVCDCDYCKVEDEECPDCDGDAKVLTEDVRHGVIGGVAVNRNYFAMILDGIDGAVCLDTGIGTGHDRYDQVRMCGEGWIAIVMPMNLSDEAMAAAPVLGL